jgi:hypothetical protein
MVFQPLIGFTKNNLPILYRTMGVLSKFLGRLRNVGRRTRKVGRNTVGLVGSVVKPATNLVGLTGRRRKSRGRKSSRSRSRSRA